MDTPRRQDSTVSSTSSGNRTVRASSTRGRRRSSASQPSIAASSLFARFTGRPRATDGDAESSPSSSSSSSSLAGPSDYWRRPRSPPAVATPAWRTSSTEECPENPEDGNADIWRPHTPTSDWYSVPPYPAATPNEDTADSDEYQRRLHDVLMQPSPSREASEEAVSPGAPRRGYQAELNDVVGSADVQVGTNGIGEEEFGSLDDASDQVAVAASPAPAVSSPAATPYLHPSISRLRSTHLRSASTATQDSRPSPLGHSRAPSYFSQISMSRSDSMSSISGLHPITSTTAPDQTPAFNFRPLRRLSAHLFSRSGSGHSSPSQPSAIPSTPLGRPTVMDVLGLIAVGTENGYVVVYTFAQEVQTVLGTENTAPVTSVTISADQTYVAVGYASGDIRLYDLSRPTKPARTTSSLTLKQIMSGRKEGHLQGSRILHLGFVGARHTSIISGDEHGRAFWWSLGKVMGVESNDVVRMLGSNPGTSPPRPTTLFAASPLPIGDSPHPTDSFQFTALLTPLKLVVVGMKPSPKTWFRKLQADSHASQSACAAWLRSGELDPGSDPVLAYSWGSTVRFLRLRLLSPTSAPEFVDGHQYATATIILALQWYDKDHILLVTTASLILLNVTTLRPVETTPFQTKLLTSNDFFSGLVAPPSIASSIRVHREKLFLLTQSNVQVGTLLHWNDRILERVHQGDFLTAIQVAHGYYVSQTRANSIGLPSEPDERHAVVGARIRELMRASLVWAFSEDRMHDDTHYSSDGRGVDLTTLFEGLASSCIEACLSMGDMPFLYDEAYESYANVGIQGVFLTTLEPYIFDGRIRDVPPSIIQALITMHESKGELDLAEAVIWHVDPVALDINQAITLCETHGLWDALIHVYTQAMHDHVAPIVKLIRLIQDHRRSSASAYALFPYIERVLSGLSYPTGAALQDASLARAQVYGFLFSGRLLTWPDGPDGEIVLPEQSDKSYPYLDTLLGFDTEAFLHSMDIAFEDPYLNDSKTAFSRQTIINIMLDSMSPDKFHSAYITLLHIFVARNLPKYPQFLFIPPSTLHDILVSLARDPDQSTREDRQLASEYMLSAYTPHDIDTMLQLFQQAGFFRILRTFYRREKKWGPLIDAFVRDPEVDSDVFTSLDEIIKSNTKRLEVTRSINEALPHLVELSIRSTALLIESNLPSLHSSALAFLDQSEHKQMVYLRCLLEPEPGHPSPSLGIDTAARHRYVSLLSTYDPPALMPFLDRTDPNLFDLPNLAAEFAQSKHYEGQLWALDRQGKTKETFETVGQILRLEGSDLGQAIVSHDEGIIHIALQTLHSVSAMAVRLCQEHAPTAEVEDMWYGVIHEIIELNHSVASLTSRDLIVDSLRALVQDTLQSLVSSPISFPRLFKRLVAAAHRGGAYSEFRSILTGMLDSYRAEGDMLRMTTRLMEADLFVRVQESAVKRQRGWRPNDQWCESCGRPVYMEDGTAGTLKVSGSGATSHLACS